jgi:hypothetical protein
LGVAVNQKGLISNALGEAGIPDFGLLSVFRVNEAASFNGLNEPKRLQAAARKYGNSVACQARTVASLATFSVSQPWRALPVNTNPAIAASSPAAWTQTRYFTQKPNSSSK